MYNIQGPSKIVAKTARRGLTQNLDNLREYNRGKPHESPGNHVPKPVFQSHKKNFRRCREEEVSPEHQEIVKFITDSWNLVWTELEGDGSQSPDSNQSATSFYEDEPADVLQNFKPFDLEAWWGRRLYALVTSSVNTQN